MDVYERRTKARAVRISPARDAIRVRLVATHATRDGLERRMANEKGPNIKKKQTCKNCEGKGLLKKGDRVVKCQRCKGTGLR
jgi:DnaJ-class molecular chaperone